MSGIHVLDGGDNHYRVVVHIATPAGQNSAGINWTDAVVNSGRAKTSLTVGNGPGQITSSEALLVTTGALLEGSFYWQDDPSLDVAGRIASVAAAAATLSSNLLARYADQLKYFGFTQ